MRPRVLIFRDQAYWWAKEDDIRARIFLSGHMREEAVIRLARGTFRGCEIDVQPALLDIETTAPATGLFQEV